MAIAQTAVVNQPNYKSWTLTALDADTTLTFNHGFTNSAGASVAPDFLNVNCLVAASATDGVNQWNVSTSATQITVTKTTAAGSGGATPGTTVVAKIVAMIPHSIMQ